MTNCPKRYFFCNDFMEECFEKLGQEICSWHLKDIPGEDTYSSIDRRYLGEWGEPGKDLADANE